jgi:hypothetical protein
MFLLRDGARCLNRFGQRNCEVCKLFISSWEYRAGKGNSEFYVKSSEESLQVKVIRQVGVLFNTYTLNAACCRASISNIQCQYRLGYPGCGANTNLSPEWQRSGLCIPWTYILDSLFHNSSVWSQGTLVSYLSQAIAESWKNYRDLLTRNWRQRTTSTRHQYTRKVCLSMVANYFKRIYRWRE